MMWDQVMTRVVDELKLDSLLSSLFGAAIYMAGTRDLIVPSIEWMLIGDTETELWSPIIVQFSIWHRDALVCRQAEFRLRSRYHQDCLILIGGDVQAWSQYLEGTMLATPDRSNIVGRALRFTFTPLRRQYALPGAGPL